MSAAVEVKREVNPHHTYDEARTAAAGRGDCVLFDLHGLWWSVPTELTVHEVAGQVAAVIAAFKLRPFPHHLGSAEPVLGVVLGVRE